MLDPELVERVKRLPAAERRELLDALYEMDDADRRFSPEFLAMIDERRADVDANPDDHVPWEQVDAEIRGLIAERRGR